VYDVGEPSAIADKCEPVFTPALHRHNRHEQRENPISDDPEVPSARARRICGVVTDYGKFMADLAAYRQRLRESKTSAGQEATEVGDLEDEDAFARRRTNSWV
jgi:hypothetical protein